MQSSIRLDECLWIRSRNIEAQSVFMPTLRALNQRGTEVWKLDDYSAESLQRVRLLVWQSNKHIILHGLLASELNALRPIFESRKNFSVLPIDWWNCPFWFSQNATFHIFHTYGGIAARTSRARFLGKNRPPLFFYPERMNRYELMSALLRPPALLAAPFLELLNQWRRMTDTVDAGRLLYFPFSITEEQAPLKTETPLYDFTNVGGTSGPWVIRDPYAPAWLNFANLYYDRKRLIDLIGQFDGRPFKVFDRRRSYSFLPWEELNRVIRQSRLMVCTGGLHQNSVPKFLEYACLGVPMIGAGVPFEFPWLDQCLFTVDAMNISAAELKLKLAEALELQPKLRDNCLALRETLLKMYHPQTLLEMAQEQIDGKPIRPGYLKASAVI